MFDEALVAELDEKPDIRPIPDPEQDAIKELRAAIGEMHKANQHLLNVQFALDDVNKELLACRAWCDRAATNVKRCQQQLVDSVKV